MKLVVCLFLMLISAKECDKNKVQESKDSQTEATSEMSEKQMQDIAKVNYLAVSRGFYLQITLEENRIFIAKERDLKSAKSYDISETDSAELMNLLSAINVPNIPGLEAPSTAHQYDGAAIATLEVIKGEDVYKTVAFDHGKPPKMIAALVEKMLLMKGHIDKQ